MYERELNLLKISGALDQNTPLCVIIEILDAHGFMISNISINKHQIYREEISKTISSLPSLKLENNMTLQDLRNIGRFINRHCNWKVNKLLTAFDFIFTSSPKPSLAELLDCGLPDNCNPLRYTASRIYYLCQEHKISMNPTDTLSQMSQKLCQRLYSRDTMLKNAQYFLPLLTTNEIFEFMRGNIDKVFSNSNRDEKARHDLINQPLHPENKNDKKSELISLYQEYHDVKRLQKAMIPRNDIQAISLGAINHNIDISHGENPLKEYLLLSLESNFESEKLRNLARLNKDLLSLKITYNPFFPVEYYESLTINFNYEEISYRYLTESFYLGFQPEIVNRESIILLTSIDDIKSSEVLCYGIRNNKMHFIPFDELASLFDKQLSFYNPITRKFFDSTALATLKKLLTSSSFSSNSSQSLLLKTIEKVDNANKSLTPEENKLRGYWNSGFHCEHIKKFLSCLSDLAMFMRGWDGKSSLPIESATVTPEEYPQVEKRVHETISIIDQIWSLEDKNNDLTDLNECLRKLPLKKYCDARVIKSNSEDQGFTLFDRIEIVKFGKSINSCIRSSSNWIASSAYNYMQLLDINPSFNIYKLRAIS